MTTVPLRQDRALLGLLVLVSLALRFPALLWPLMPDEAGFLMVAQQWDPRPDSLYGELWVDRPPLLIATYAAASALLGDYGVRWVAALLGVASVLVAHRIGVLVGERRSGLWAASALVVVGAWPSLAGWAGKSESLGVPFVLLACWAVLESVRRAGAPALALAGIAGIAAAMAVGMKQNLVGGVVLVAVLLLAHLLRGSLPRAGVLARAVAATLGFLLPVGAALLWGMGVGVGPGLFWDTLYGFRTEALRALAEGGNSAAGARAARLAAIALGTGVALQALLLLAFARPLLRRRPEVVLAVLALLAVDVAGLVLGGSYWPAYLQSLVPVTVLAVALTSSLPAFPGVLPRLVTIGAAVAMLVALGRHAVPDPPTDPADAGVHVGRAVGTAAAPSDTLTVLYGSPNVVWASGLRPGYAHLWSLPARTLDPHLGTLHRELVSDEPPTWVVLLGPVDAWGLDSRGLVRAALVERYDLVGRVCGARVLRLRAVERADLPPVDCSRPATRWGE